MGDIERRAFVILGHGSETIPPAPRPGTLAQPPLVVPDGCLLIVSEECGVLGTLPDYIYKVLSDPANKEKFEHPEDNLHELERLLRKPLRLYRPGDSYPNMNYLLFNDDRDPSDTSLMPKTVEVYTSGVQPLPIPDKNLDLRPKAAFPESLRVTTYTGSMDPRLLIRMYKGSIYPKEEDIDAEVKRKTMKNASELPEYHHWTNMKIDANTLPINMLRVSQEKLFSSTKGIYFMFLCRAIKGLEDALTKQLEKPFSKSTVKKLKNTGFNTPGTVLNWIQGKRAIGVLSEKQSRAINATEAAVKTIIRRREESRERHGLTVAESPAAQAFRLLHLSEDQRRRLRPRLNELLTTVPPTSVEPQTGDTLLILAAEQGDTESVDLLRTRVPLDLQNHAGYTAAMAAAEGGKRGIVDTLLTNGASTTLVAVNGTTLLHLLAEDNATDLLTRILPGVNIRAVTATGETALHGAARYDSLQCARALLAVAPDLVEMKNVDGESAFHLACKSHSAAVAKLCMKQRINPNEKTANGKTGILLALENSDYKEERVPDIFHTLVANGVSLDDPRILKTAMLYDLDDIGTFLLRNGASVGKLEELRDIADKNLTPDFVDALDEMYPPHTLVRRVRATRRQRPRRRKTRRRHR